MTSELGGIPHFYLTRKHKKIDVTNEELVNCMSKKNSRIYRDLNKALFFMKHGTTIKKSDIENFMGADLKRIDGIKTAMTQAHEHLKHPSNNVKEVKKDQETEKIGEIFLSNIPGIINHEKPDVTLEESKSSMPHVDLDKSKEESGLPVDEKSMSHVSLDKSKEESDLPLEKSSESSVKIEEDQEGTTSRDVSLEDENK